MDGSMWSQGSTVQLYHFKVEMLVYPIHTNHGSENNHSSKKRNGGQPRILIGSSLPPTSQRRPMCQKVGSDKLPTTPAQDSVPLDMI